MKILVIGGTRFFGYFIVKRLVEDGHQVTLFNRGKTPDDFGHRLKRIRGDRYDHRAFFKKLDGKKYDVVVDMIAFKADDSRTAVKTFLGNIGHYFHISTGAVYAVTKDFPCPLSEQDFDRLLYPKRGKSDEFWDYGFHKRKCEEVLSEAYQKQGFPSTRLRPPIVMGERDHTLRAYSYFIRILDGRPLILPDGGLTVSSYVYQDDVVRAVSSNLLNVRSFGQAYNLAQAEVITLRAFVLRAAEILNRKVELVDIPTDVLDKTGLGTSFSPLSMRRLFILNTQKARRDLNFSSTPFEAWMRKTVQWFVEEYKGGPPENYRLRERELAIIRSYKKAVESIRI
jgi:nucleoside-diphosphate-sugar epimerase